LSAYVQGVWSASVSPQVSVGIKRWLQGDAGSGILFNLGKPIVIGENSYPVGPILLPVNKQAYSISLPAGAQLAGIRFHPAVGFGVLGAHYDQPTTVASIKKSILTLKLQSITRQLDQTTGHRARIVVLYRLLNKAFDFSNVMPASLMQALNVMQRIQKLDRLTRHIVMSQRQLERQFRKRMGLTPKEFLRILRVKKTITFLKHNPDAGLVELANNNGFADQAHMTREFKQFAKITPKQYCRIASGRYRDF